MTQDSHGFTLITVHDDEDDVVIQAGMPTPAEDVAAPQTFVDTTEGDEVFADDEVSREFVAEEVSDDGGIFGGDDVDDNEAEGAADENNWADQDDQADSSDLAQRYETTAEDLVSDPMPTAQKITLALVVVIFVATVVYCVAHFL